MYFRDLTTTMEKYVYKDKNRNLRVCFFSADIRKVNADAIVIGEGPRLDVESLVTQTLLENTPMFKERRQEFKSKHSFLDLWSVTHSFLGTVFEYVIHAVMDTGNNEIWLKKMKSLYHKVFKEVENLKQHSVALPLLGTGAASTDSCLAIKAVVSAILSYKAERHIKIIIVCKDKTLLDETGTMLLYRQYYPEPSKNILEQTVMLISEIFEPMPHRSPVPDKATDKRQIKASQILRHQNQVESDEEFEIIFVEEARERGKIKRNEKNMDTLQKAIRLSEEELKRTLCQSKSHNSRKAYSREDYEFQRAIELSKRDSAANPMSVTTSVKPPSLLSHSTTNERNTDSCVSCPICLSLVTEPEQLDKCGHIFCKDCIDRSFREYKPVCPSCNIVYGVITGNQPDGQMDVGYSGDHLPGYEGHRTITITYYFPSGTQGENHPNPGRPYKGTTRRAYLPDSGEGKMVLRLLRKAFDQKLIFTIGQSTTTGQDGVVTWNDIHHKTNMTGGPTRFGYPDPTYLQRVRDELECKGVRE